MDRLEFNSKDLLQYSWNYFQLHASQRLTTFNFYIIISTVVATGYLAIIKDASMPLFGLVLGLLLTFLSFIFWKLDMRNKQMIKNAEEALKYIESSFKLNADDAPDILKIFTYEERRTNIIKQKKLFCLQKHYSYSKCFNLVFFVIGSLGFLALIYAASLLKA